MLTATFVAALQRFDTFWGVMVLWMHPPQKIVENNVEKILRDDARGSIPIPLLFRMRNGFHTFFDRLICVIIQRSACLLFHQTIYGESGIGVR